MVRIHRLDNGLRLAMEQPRAHSAGVCISIGICGGWANDPIGKCGLSRVTALAATTLNPKLRRTMRGQQVGIGVAHDRTHWRVTVPVPACWFQAARGWLEEAWADPVIDAACVQRMVNLTPDMHALILPVRLDPFQESGTIAMSSIVEPLFDYVYAGHPVGRSLSTRPSQLSELASITLDDVVAESQNQLNPQQLVVGVSGQFDPDEFLAWADGYFSRWRNRRMRQVSSDSRPVPQSFVQVVPNDSIHGVSVAFAWAAVAPDETAHNIARQLVFLCLSEEMCTLSDVPGAAMIPLRRSCGTAHIYGFVLRAVDLPMLQRMYERVEEEVARLAIGLDDGALEILRGAIPWGREVNLRTDPLRTANWFVDRMANGADPIDEGSAALLLQQVDPDQVAASMEHTYLRPPTAALATVDQARRPAAGELQEWLRGLCRMSSA